MFPKTWSTLREALAQLHIVVTCGIQLTLCVMDCPCVLQKRVQFGKSVTVQVLQKHVCLVKESEDVQDVAEGQALIGRLVSVISLQWKPGTGGKSTEVPCNSQ